MFMVTSTHIAGKVYLAFCVNVPDKTTLLATVGASNLVATFVFLQYKSILCHNNCFQWNMKEELQTAITARCKANTTIAVSRILLVLLS